MIIFGSYYVKRGQNCKKYVPTLAISKLRHPIEIRTPEGVMAVWGDLGSIITVK